MLTYTVRPMYFYSREMVSGFKTLSRTPQGFLTVIREGDKVVHQFPRMENQELCHKMAQRHIAGLKATAIIDDIRSMK